MSDHDPIRRPTNPATFTALSRVRVETTPHEHWHTIAYDEYKNTHYTARNRQLEIVKQYLWIASALLTFELFFINELAVGDKIKILSMKPDPVYYLLETIAVIQATVAFFLSIWLMKGRNSDGVVFPFSFPDSKEMLEYLGSVTFDDYLSENIDSLHEAIRKERNVIREIGKDLRSVCHGLLISFGVQAGAILWMIARTAFQ